MPLRWCFWRCTSQSLRSKAWMPDPYAVPSRMTSSRNTSHVGRTSSPRAEHEIDHGHLRMVCGTCTELEHDLRVRIPHTRSWFHRGPRNRLHAVKWHRVHHSGHGTWSFSRRCRTQDVLLLQLPQRFLRGDRKFRAARVLWHDLAASGSHPTTRNP